MGGLGAQFELSAPYASMVKITVCIIHAGLAEKLLWALQVCQVYLLIVVSQQCHTLGLTTVGLKSGHQSPLDLTYLPRGHGLNTGEALKDRRIQHSLSYKEHQF